MALRFGVVGLGAMGRHHVRVISEMPDVDLVAVADPSEEAREGVERERPATTYASSTEMFERAKLDAVVIAVPTIHHEATATAVLDAGLHVLIEKPLAASIEGVANILRHRGSGQVATVGHIERYNPAVLKLVELLQSGELGRLFQVRARRTGPLPIRIQDVGVVTDLATHDLDLINYLVPGRVQSIFALTAQRIHAMHEDLVTALLSFDSEVVGLLDTNWLTPVKIREMTVIGDAGMYRLDFINQDVFFYENSANPYWNGRNGRAGVSEGNMVRFQIDRREPLRVELEMFASVIRGERDEKELVSLEDGALAVSLAEAVLESARKGVPVMPRFTDAESTSELPVI
ncbi:MAG: Gfo/Idh/MocA family oxidoreductase [Actinomycetota bacterium]|nr:Gfo/Idh/MocA family oxidoreductase [Actinomycetota bacterium]MDK1096226.1 Gfo/Idh/MocA family oxidoreductase [Actinomycetota bacterium]MDK1103214.1 Gfo/Idh/MocA family oxidoreductase [Actinomycetota bacterium]